MEGKDNGQILNVKYSQLLTPIITALLIIIGIIRKDNLILFVINLLLIGSRYYFIKILNDIGRAEAGVRKLL